MGSMTDVMKKVWESAASGDAQPDANAPTPPPDAESAQSGFLPADDPIPVDHQPPMDDPLAEVLQPAADKPNSSIVTDPETIEWDAARVDPAIVAFVDQSSAICEQYRSVRARLLTMNRNNTPQVIVVTSSVPQEGKSVSTLNLGIVMAGGGEHNIVLVDADLRRTSIARLLGIDMDGKKGLADLLCGESTIDQVVLPTPFPNLKIIPAGQVNTRNYAELMGSSTARAVLADLRQSFDYAFVDTPPVTTVSDVSMMAPFCDGAILVIEMRRTPEPTVQAAVRTLQTNNIKILGCILARYREERAGYYDRYYRYYRND